MDVVIFCGGRGTRLAEKTGIVPKPLVPIGDRPILWHIMKTYEHYGHRRFILTLGYKGEMIKDYFVKYPWLHCSFEINSKNAVFPACAEDWSVLLKDTGEKSTTGKRLNLVKEDIKSNPFLVTYGDGLADVDVNKVIDLHNKMKTQHGTIATIVITHPRIKYGVIKEKDDIALDFNDKAVLGEWINIGFMVMERDVFRYIKDNEMDYEALKAMAAEKKLAVFKHGGFFASMDTYKDYVDLNAMWKDKSPWKVWKE